MHYSCPDCRQDREVQSHSQAIVYRQTTIVVDQVPGAVCLTCGSVSLHPDTLAELDGLLRSRRRPRPRLDYSRP